MALASTRTPPACQTPVESEKPDTLAKIARKKQRVRTTSNGRTTAEGTATAYTTRPDGGRWLTVENADGTVVHQQLGEGVTVFTT